MNYLEGMIESLSSSVLTNWTMQEQILPISIENFEFDPKLITAPKTMKDFQTQYKYRKEITEEQDQKEIEEANISSKLGSFLDNFMVDMLFFIAALITIVFILVVYIWCADSQN